jgi:TonB family protein
MRQSLSLAAALLATSFAAHAQDGATGPQVAIAAANLPSLAHRQLLRKTLVAYPKSVVPEDREASVMLRYTIEADGHVDHVEIIKGSTAPFNIEAEKAVGSWLYQPANTPTLGAVAIVEFHAAP